MPSALGRFGLRGLGPRRAHHARVQNRYEYVYTAVSAATEAADISATAVRHTKDLEWRTRTAEPPGCGIELDFMILLDILESPRKESVTARTCELSVTRSDRSAR